MQNISGYLGNPEEEIVDTEHKLSVSSCGHYKLSADEQFHTWRPFGRQDYQLLYVASGAVDFYFDDTKITVTAESLVLIYPGEPQKYTYRPESRPDVYWVHFSGTDVRELLKTSNFYPEHVFPIRAAKDCTLLFDRIIRELQLKRGGFLTLTALYMEELLILLSRNISDQQSGRSQNLIVEQAMIYFHKEYQNPISVQEYADQNNISCCWFIRSFRQHTGMTPVQYLTSIRINKAKELLNTGSFNVSQTAAAVGYDNPLYFSRVFKKNTGISPKAYQKRADL